MGLKTSLTKEYIKKRIAVSDAGCWEWLRSTYTYGYGVTWCSINKRIYPAHRVAFGLWRAFDFVTDTRWVLHKCDNGKCCNPSHLYIGTPKENSRDRHLRGRANNKFGENNANAKLSNLEVFEIRVLLAQGYPQREIGHAYGVSRSYLWQLKANIKRKQG